MVQSIDNNGSINQWMNLFEILNLEELESKYRLLKIDGIPQLNDYDKRLNQLRKVISFEIQQPVALVKQDNTHFFAIPADSRLPNLEQPSTPHIAILEPLNSTILLKLTHLDENTMPIAIEFLGFAIRQKLWSEENLWGTGRAYYHKYPENQTATHEMVDIFPGFIWNIIAIDNRFFLTIDVTASYIDRLWLPERSKCEGKDLHYYLRRHCLYHFGNHWYTVQFWGLTGKPIIDQQFLLKDSNSQTNVFDYTREKCNKNIPPWISNLDPQSPAIIYRYPGKSQDNYAALTLCKLKFSTKTMEDLHKKSIITPTERFKQIQKITANYFQNIRLNNKPMKISVKPLQIERHLFRIPAQVFGHGRILVIGPNTANTNAEIIKLEQLGRSRLNLILNHNTGPLDLSPFDTQYFMTPRSLPREIVEDLKNRFITTMREVSHQQNYVVSHIIYDDIGCRSLYKQVQSIKEAIHRNKIDRGYVFLVFPDHVDEHLHNCIKRELWPDIQFQCASGSEISKFYQKSELTSKFQIIIKTEYKLKSYIRYCAYGMMIVNRKWLWALASPLHYDIYIGIDVLNSMAGFTFIYNNAHQIFFRNAASKQKERLTKQQIENVLISHLRKDLMDLKIKPRSIVIHRDGRSFESELEGLNSAIKFLKIENILPNDVKVGVVDIRKTNSDHFRLTEGTSLQNLQNPTTGSFKILNPKQGVICCTGQPFQIPGTTNPLVALIIQGELNINWVLEDIFSLSQLTFSAPEKCSRLPLTIKLADSFLEPIASEYDEERAHYDEDLLVSSENDEEESYINSTNNIFPNSVSGG